MSTGHEFDMHGAAHLEKCKLCGVRLIAPAADQRCLVAFPKAAKPASSPRYRRNDTRRRSPRDAWRDEREVPTWWNLDELRFSQSPAGELAHQKKIAMCPRKSELRCFTYLGLTRTIVEWSYITEIENTVLFYRFASGWSAKRALCSRVEERTRRSHGSP